jgi:hypothetical protein
MRSGGCRFLSILLPFFISLLALGLTWYVAWRQRHADHLKFKHDLYERRLAFYDIFVEFLNHVSRTKHADMTKMAEFQQKTREAYFLFGEDIADYVETIRKKAIELDTRQTMLENSSPQDIQTAEKQNDLIIWFGKQFLVAREMFAKYMKLS